MGQVPRAYITPSVLLTGVVVEHFVHYSGNIVMITNIIINVLSCAIVTLCPGDVNFQCKSPQEAFPRENHIDVLVPKCPRFAINANTEISL